MKKQSNIEKAELKRLKKIILNPEIDLRFRKAELRKISERETLVLAEIFYRLKNKMDYVLLIDLVEKIQNERLAYWIARDRTNDFVLREIAIRKIRTQRWLFELAVRNDDWKVRKMAVSRMNDVVMLKMLIKSTKNSFIVEMAKRRIEEVKNRDAWLRDNPKDSL